MSKPSLFIIDDDAIISEIISTYFQEKGFHVWQASTAKEALTKLKKCIPDVILCDVELPQTLGTALIKNIKEIEVVKDTPILLLSSTTDQNYILDGLANGATDYLSKPIEMQALFEKIDSLVTHHSYKILVADDDPIVSEILQYSLEAEGYEISIEGDGNQVLSEAKKIKPDLILLDRMMPGKEGLMILKDLKEDQQTQAIPVFIISSKTQEREIVEALKAGAEDYIRKPIKLDALCIRIERQLRP